MRHEKIDNGKSFDWGHTSADYAKYRDVYPECFYQRLLDMGLCIKGQSVLDLGTGTGVLPRNLVRYGAEFTGVDVSPEQISYARKLSEGTDIQYVVSSAEDIQFPDNSFDLVTSCQSYQYFNYPVLLPKLARLLKPGGRFVLLFMEWLPYEDKIAEASENLVLRYNPSWSGAGFTRCPIQLPQEYLNGYFTQDEAILFDVNVPFTRESWNGRMKSCRGIGASLSAEKTEQFSREHLQLLEKIAPEQFEILHSVNITVLHVIK